MATKRAQDAQTRANRKAAGYVSVLVNLPPSLAALMEQARGELSRAEWVVQQVAAATAVEPGEIHRRPGRPRKPVVAPSQPVALADVTYRCGPLDALVGRYCADPFDYAGCIGRDDHEDGTTSLHWTYQATFGDFDPYKKINNVRGRRYSGGCWTVPTPAAERLCAQAAAAGATVVPLSPPEMWPGVIVDVRPIIRMTGDAPEWWTIEIDFERLAETVDRRVLGAFARRYRSRGWAQVDGEEGGRVLSGALSQAEFNEVKADLVRRHVGIAEGPPVGMTDRPVTATKDSDLGLTVALDFDARDRRTIGLPTVVPLRAWPYSRDDIIARGFDLVEQGWAPREIPKLAWASVPGGDQPVHGRCLKPFQREGVEFIVAQRGRCVLADEMGTGKTAEIVVAFEVMGAVRRLVICPRNAVGTWMGRKATAARPAAAGEIQKWCAEPQTVVEIASATDIPTLPERGWVVVTYDVLTPKAETIPLSGFSGDSLVAIHQAFLGTKAETSLVVRWADPEKTQIAECKLRLDPDDEQALDVIEGMNPVKGFKNPRLADALGRVRGKVRAALLDWNADAVAVDEAHKIKNAAANRTRTVRLVIQDPGRAVVLATGTPIRNRAEEGLALLESIIPIAEYREKAGQYRLSRVQLAAALLEKHMIRRRKSDVLEQLPPKIRQRIDIPRGPKAQEHLEAYLAAMDAAQAAYNNALLRTRSRAEAAMAALGSWSAASRILGLAKVADGIIADTIADTVDERGACLAFVHHRDVLALLQRQLEERGLTVAVIHGETSGPERFEAERAFQAGEVDVFLGSITAAGEAITLTRADTCLFAELTWVPAELLQAEDRGHRQGQEAAGYHILTCLADLGLDPAEDIDLLMWSSLARKCQEIGEILDEDVSLAFDSAGVTSVRDALEGRAWQRAQEHLKKQGLSDGEIADIGAGAAKKTEKKKAKKRAAE